MKTAEGCHLLADIVFQPDTLTVLSLTTESLEVFPTRIGTKVINIDDLPYRTEACKEAGHSIMGLFKI